MDNGSARIGEVFNFGMLHLEWPTALFVLCCFVLTVIVLNTMLFKPIIRTLEARQSDLDKNKGDAKDLAQTVEKSEQDYQDKLSEMKVSIQQSRQEALDAAMTSAKSMVEDAKSSVSNKLEESTKEMEQERTNALKEAASLTSELSQLIKSKVLA